MNITVWITFYIIGIITLLVGGCWIWKKVKHKPLGGILLIFVVSFIWYLPVELSRNTMNIWNIMEAVFYSVLQGISVVKIDNYSRDVTGSTYEILLLFNISIMILRTVAAYFLVFGLGELFVKGFSRIGDVFNRRKKTYIFFGANEKTILIAKSICDSDNYKPGKKVRILFLAENVKNDAIRNKIRECGGILFEDKIKERLSKFIIQGNKSKYDIEVFLFEEEENDNFVNLGLVKEVVMDLPEKYVNRLVRVYVEINTATEELLDQIKQEREIESAKKRLVVNCVQTRANFIKNTLLKYSIFDTELKRNGTKIVKALIIGSDQYCFDFFRHILELCQMPGYMLEVTILGDAEQFLGKIMTYSPALIENTGREKFANYQYSIIDIREFESVKFMNSIKESSDFTIAFISSGNSGRNRILSYRILKERTDKNLSCKVLVNSPQKSHYSIQPSKEFYIVKQKKKLEETKTKYGEKDKNYEDAKKKYINEKEKYKYLDGYKVYEIGANEEIYSYKNITASQIDAISRIVHEVRHKDKPWEEYSANEYERRSVYARTVSIVFRVCEILEEYKERKKEENNPQNDNEKVSYINKVLKEDKWLLYEHMRWDVYMMTNGFVRGEEKDLYAKTHHLLVDYDALTESQRKDEIKIDVNCLVEIEKLKSERK